MLTSHYYFIYMENYSNKIELNDSEIKNSKLNIILPLVFAGILAVGIGIGYFLRPASAGGDSAFGFGFRKVEAVLQILSENYVDPLTSDSLEELAIPHILEGLDPHTSYIPAEDMADATDYLKGNFEGIGVHFNIQNDTIMVVNTIAGGPSEKAGVLAGDRIIFINDTLFAGIGVKNEDVTKNLKGESGSSVKIKVKRHGIKDLIEFKIKRGKVPIYSVDAAYMADKTIGYIKISQFAATTHSEFLSAVMKLKSEGMTSLILDLRSNGGGYMDAAVKLADEFLTDGKMIVYTAGNAQERFDYFASNAGTCEDIEITVLIDSWSASASEIVSGAIQDNDRGMIIGRRSYGKGLVQQPFYFKDGSGVRITVARYYTPTGRCIQKPYDKGTDEYHTDILKRSMHGEFTNPDSAKVSNKEQYITPGGKIVFGGGGIMPDIFVAQDTSFFTDFFEILTRKNLIYNFAYSYTDKNRTALTKFKTQPELVKFLDNNRAFDEFMTFVKSQKIESKPLDMVKSNTEIKTRLYAYIVRNILDESGFYRTLNQSDTDVRRAIEEFNKP